MKAPASCPSLEALAAYVDRRLPVDERSEVGRHLASCSECFRVYADVVEMEEAMGREDELELSGVAVRHDARFRRPRRWVVACSLAAALLAAAVLLPHLLQRDSSDVHALLASAGVHHRGEVLRSSLPPRWARPAWSQSRGRELRIDREAASLRLGVLTLDLEVALRCEDPATARQLVLEIRELLPALEARSLTPGVEVWAQRLERGEQVFDRALLRRLKAAADARRLQLGLWLAAARLAAARTAEAPESADWPRIARRLGALGLAGSAQLLDEPSEQARLARVDRWIAGLANDEIPLAGRDG